MQAQVPFESTDGVTIISIETDKPVRRRIGVIRIVQFAAMLVLLVALVVTAVEQQHALDALDAWLADHPAPAASSDDAPRSRLDDLVSQCVAETRRHGLAGSEADVERGCRDGLADEGGE